MHFYWLLLWRFPWLPAAILPQAHPLLRLLQMLQKVLLKHRLTQHLQKLLKAQHPTVTLKISALSLTGIRMRCIPLSTLPLKKDTMRKKDWMYMYSSRPIQMMPSRWQRPDRRMPVSTTSQTSSLLQQIRMFLSEFSVRLWSIRWTSSCLWNPATLPVPKTWKAKSSAIRALSTMNILSKRWWNTMDSPMTMWRCRMWASTWIHPWSVAM